MHCKFLLAEDKKASIACRLNVILSKSIKDHLREREGFGLSLLNWDLFTAVTGT
jgi:hypothetical protein